MLHQEIGSIEHVKNTGGILILHHNGAKDCDYEESALAWCKILAEVERQHPLKGYQFVPHSYVEKKNQGHTMKQQFLQSMLAVPK